MDQPKIVAGRPVGFGMKYMAKPVTISTRTITYSAKYEGVIGRGLGRCDLIIEANDNELWESGQIVKRVAEKTDYVLTHYEQLRHEITERVTAARRQAEETLRNL